ncbi:unnamed protein product [Trichobilharzia szidati]|nr:unnamed protein product [Trichobilharzia szidati]
MLRVINAFRDNNPTALCERLERSGQLKKRFAQQPHRSHSFVLLQHTPSTNLLKNNHDGVQSQSQPAVHYNYNDDSDDDDHNDNDGDVDNDKNNPQKNEVLHKTKL